VNPLIGVIFKRDAHPAAKSLAELTNPLRNSSFFCDEHLSLHDALHREWEEDAHLILYALHSSETEWTFARTSKHSALPEQLVQAAGFVRVSLVCLDHDLPDKREWASAEEPLDWLASMPEGTPSPTAWYSTLHGSRFVFVLATPVDHLRAEEIITALLEKYKLPEGTGQIDRRCLDWTRLFRLPKTRREDTGKFFSKDPRFFLIDGGPLLDPSSLPKVDVSEAKSTYAEIQPYTAAMPEPEECQKLLWLAGSNGRPAMSFYMKEAKRFLQGREAFGVCFEDALLDTSQGWNNSALRLVGQVVSMTAHLESASPEHVFALVRPALEQLTASDQEHADWLSLGWSMVCRMWSQESAQLEAQRIDREQAAAEAAKLKVALAEQLRVERPLDVPEDPQERVAWFARRMVASDGSRHYVMRRDGGYNLKAIGDSMLIPMIRELGMEAAIPINEMRGRSWGQRSAQAILNDHAIPITSIRCSTVGKVAYINGEEGSKVLYSPVHRLNPKLIPARSPEVEEWLALLFGDFLDHGIDWLSHALDVLSPICALNLHGAPGSGKGMLVLGLSECFDGEHLNDGRAMDRFNFGLLQSPIIWCDEGVPMIKGLGNKVDQIFRSLVAGGSIQIEGKMRDIITAEINPRIVLTSNNKDIARDIIGQRDLSDEDVRAIELRMLSIDIKGEAHRFLSAKGNREYTHGWVKGNGASNYVLANHIYWLYENRKPSKFSSGRLLVEGEAATELVRDMRLRSEDAQLVLRAIARILETPTSRTGLHIAEGRAFITISTLRDYIDTMGTYSKITMSQVSKVLKQFSAKQISTNNDMKVSHPLGARHARWIELDLAMILEECYRYGMPSERIEGLLQLQVGGVSLIAQARVHGKADEVEA